MAGRPGRGRRETYGERLARRASIDDPEIALNAAARFVEVRSRSIEEVRRHLTGAGYRSGLVETAVARLIELGVLDDEVFARSWLEARDRSRPRSDRALRHELFLKGLDRATIDAALEEREERRIQWLVSYEPSEEFSQRYAERERTANEASADRLLAKHRKSLARIADPRIRRQRAYALLARNGFDPDVCRQAVARFAESHGAPEDEE